MRHGRLMVNALISGSSGPSLSSDRGHCVVFLGKTLDSHSASLHLDRLASHPGGSRNTPSRFMLQKLGKAPA